MRRCYYIYGFIFFLTGLANALQGQSYIKRSDFLVSKYFNQAAPVMTSAGLVYCSDKTSGSIMNYTKDGMPMYNIYILPRKGKNEWGSPQLFSATLKTNQNDGPISFSGNGKLAVFTRNYSLKSYGSDLKGNPNFGLFFADSTEAGWTNIREFEYNDHDAHTTHPSLDSSGTTLYFASDRKGGIGGYDLYVSYFKNGEWTRPVNLGSPINSPGNEIYPYIHPSGRLYFSSDSHDNTKDYDLFYSEIYNNQWMQPVKLPSPYNSKWNDFTYYADKDFNSGFFTSDSPGTITSDSLRTMGIFSFTSTMPAFDNCKEQVDDNFCYLFKEENTVTLDTMLYVYEWHLGDSTTQRAKEAKHCYSGPGDYTVKLDVIDKLTGIVQFNQAEYEVEVRKTIQSYITCPDTIKTNTDFAMNALESYFGDATPGKYYWDFGDGSWGMGDSVTHRYAIPGNYNVKLLVIEKSNDPETARRFCSYKTIVVGE